MMNPFPSKAVALSLAMPSLVPAQPTTECRQWRVAEFAFEAQTAHQHTPLGVQFGGRFTGPDGSVYDVPGFWDGGQTWRLRFAPTLPGEWSYETTSVEAESRMFADLYQGDTMHGNDAAQRVDVALGDAEELILIVKDAGDGTNYDHADWADAHFVKRDGSIVYLDTLTADSTRQGHGKLSFRTNIPGHPLRIADRAFERGLGSHAPGRTVYKLDGTEVRFRAWVGIDAIVKERGSVRFAVATSTRNTERVGHRDGGLHGKTGTFTVLPATGDNPLYRHGGFLRVSQDGHSLTYADGTPFFWLGDTWWFCPSDLVPIDTSTNPEIPSAYRDMIEVRKQQGFTTVHMAFLGTIDGLNPYQDSTRGPSLSPAYWQKVDRYIDYANENGIMPVIGMGWGGRPLSTGDWQTLWRHLIARCGSHAVTWLVCGEYNVKGTDEIVDKTMALGAFIKQTDPYHRAMTIHPWYYIGDRRQAWDQPWYDFAMLQGGHGTAPPIDVYVDAYNRTPARPILEGECQYEGIHKFTDADVRNVAYRAIQNGSFGYTYGSQGLWYPTQNTEDKQHDNWGEPLVWWKALRRPGAEQLGVMRQTYETVDWWRLKPALDLVTPSPPTDAPDTDVIADFVELFGQATADNAHWARLDEHQPGCVALHPLGEGDAVLAYPPIPLPTVHDDKSLKLVLALGFSKIANVADPKHPFDGVRFSVRVQGKEVFAQHRATKPWSYTAIDLTAYAGKKVELALVTAAGANMNWDHALFRRPSIVKVSRANEDPCRDAYLAPPPRAVFAKADGDQAIVLYYPASTGCGTRTVRHLPDGAVYAATWHNPRTGEATPVSPRPVADNALPVPEPPDDHDWVLVLRREQ